MDFYRRAIRIVHARLGLVSNNRDLLARSEYFADRVPQSLLTDYHRVDEVAWEGDPAAVDAEIRIVDDKGDLWLIPGGADAGKTVFLLEGLTRGWTIFSTEMTHLRLTAGGYEFYKGSLFDNIRLGTLLYDFPAVVDRLGVTVPPSPDPWGAKIALDLGHVQTPADVLVSPSFRIVNPKVESGRDRAVVTALGRREKLVKLLFDN